MSASSIQMRTLNVPYPASASTLCNPVPTKIGSSWNTNAMMPTVTLYIQRRSNVLRTIRLPQMITTVMTEAIRNGTW